MRVATGSDHAAGRDCRQPHTDPGSPVTRTYTRSRYSNPPNGR